MAKYLQTAAKASIVIDDIITLIKDHPNKEYILHQIIYLYNLGIRTSPRACQSTVRYNAVKEAAKNQPCKISMTEKKDPTTGFTYKALCIDRVEEPKV